MFILNHSGVKLDEVQPLVDFVSQRTEKSYLAYLHLREDSPVPGSMAGLAEKDSGTYFALKSLAPSVVTFWIHSNKNNYPIITCHRVSVGKVRIETWEEEVVFILAHELRHIDQFWSDEEPAKQAEVDAERFAVSILNEYRKSIGKDPIVPIRLDRRRTRKNEQRSENRAGRGRPASRDRRRGQRYIRSGGRPRRRS